MSQEPYQTLGVTPPISLAPPTDQELQSTEDLVKTLHDYDLFESEQEAQKRVIVLGKLDKLVKEFVYRVSKLKGFPDALAKEAGGKIFTFGSYRLGVHGAGTDIDTLCVFPKHVEREHFFTIMYDMLKERPEVTELTSIPDAYVPVINMYFSGIPIDFLCARLGVARVPDDLELSDNNLLKNLDDRCVRSINGSRVTDEILRLVPNIPSFRIALRTIKFWAKRRGIYSNIMGFLGGVAWAMLVARICQLYPNACAAALVNRFFRIMFQWKWPQPVLLKHLEDGPLQVRVWNPKLYPSDRNHRMPIITPAYPSMCATHNVTNSTRTIMIKEFDRGGTIAGDTLTGSKQWKDLFVKGDFFHTYKHYLQVIASSASTEAQLKWSGLVESKLRQIVAKVEVMELILLAHPYIKGMDKVHYITADEKGDATRGVYPLDRTFHLEEGSMETDYFKKIKESGVWPDDKMDDLSPLYTTTFYIGLSIQRKSKEDATKTKRQLDLKAVNQEFNILVKSSDIYDAETMTIVMKNVRAKDLPADLVNPQKQAQEEVKTQGDQDTNKRKIDNDGNEGEHPTKKVRAHEEEPAPQIHSSQVDTTDPPVDFEKVSEKDVIKRHRRCSIMFQSLAHRIVGNQPETTPSETSTETTLATESTNDDTSSPNPRSPTSLQPSSVSKTAADKRNHLDIDDSDNSISCPICKDNMAEAFVTRCGHSFCYQCISLHLDKHSNCPICRQDLRKSQITPNFQLNTIIEQQLAIRKMSHAPDATSNTNMKSLVDYIDTLPYTDDVHTILYNAFTKRMKYKTREEDIQARLLSYFLTIAQTHADEECQKWDQNQDMVHKDVLSIRQKSPLQAHLAGNMGNGDRSEDDNSDGPGDTTGYRMPSPENSEQNVQGRPRKRKHSEEDDITTPQSSKINEVERILAPKKGRIFQHLSDLIDLYFTNRKGDGLEAFSTTLYQMTRYSKWIPLDSIHYADISTNSAIVSSIEFNRDEDYIAVGGVTKEIKIYDFGMVNERVEERATQLVEDETEVETERTNGSPVKGRRLPLSTTINTSGRSPVPAMVHCPLQTIDCDYKISCLSWNPYIKSRLASSDYEGIINIWDTTTGQNVRSYEEHEKRAWSVDTSATNPTIMASGSDDSTVKIWSTQARWSVLTLQQRGNVCCAKFAPNDEHLIAVGSANHHITCYDLRYAKTHLQVFSGHGKAVSYVKWNSDNEIISASTDNTLKLWKLDSKDCIRTYSGHQNEKNFVGLSLKDDWISCGSENNTLYTYHKNSSHPVAQYMFPVTDPITGHESYSESSLFVSSVCWKRDSTKILAANSKGTIKVLQLVE